MNPLILIGFIMFSLTILLSVHLKKLHLQWRNENLLQQERMRRLINQACIPSYKELQLLFKQKGPK